LACQVYAYCLMSNHVHLLINPGPKAVNRAVLMKRVAGR
jgi:putative transposase